MPCRVAFPALLLVVATLGCSGPPQATGPIGPVVEPSAAALSASQQETLDAASAAHDAGEYADAMALFREVLSENPIAVDAHVGIGQIYLSAGHWSQAEPAFARAAKLSPRDFGAQYGHGVALQMMQRFVEAVRAYHRALTIEPENVGANLNLATTYLQMGRPRSAQVFAQRAVDLGDGGSQAFITLGATLQLLGQEDRALEQYIAAAEAMSDPSPPLMRNIMHLLSRQKRYTEVANTAEQLVRIDPTTDAYERLGWARFRLGEYEPSARAYRMAVEYNDENWRALNGVGVNALNAWLLSDRSVFDAYEEARWAFRRSLETRPDQPKVITLVLRYGL